jgi:hypothetical protein
MFRSSAQMNATADRPSHREDRPAAQPGRPPRLDPPRSAVASSPPAGRAEYYRSMIPPGSSRFLTGLQRGLQREWTKPPCFSGNSRVVRIQCRPPDDTRNPQKCGFFRFSAFPIPPNCPRFSPRARRNARCLRGPLRSGRATPAGSGLWQPIRCSPPAPGAGCHCWLVQQWSSTHNNRSGATGVSCGNPGAHERFGRSRSGATGGTAFGENGSYHQA